MEIAIAKVKHFVTVIDHEASGLDDRLCTKESVSTQTQSQQNANNTVCNLSSGVDVAVDSAQKAAEVHKIDAKICHTPKVLTKVLLHPVSPQMSHVGGQFTSTPNLCILEQDACAPVVAVISRDVPHLNVECGVNSYNTVTEGTKEACTSCSQVEVMSDFVKSNISGASDPMSIDNCGVQCSSLLSKGKAATSDPYAPVIGELTKCTTTSCESHNKHYVQGPETHQASSDEDEYPRKMQIVVSFRARICTDEELQQAS